MNRRLVLGGTAAALLAACSHLPTEGDTLLEPQGPRSDPHVPHVPLDNAAWLRLLARLRAADFVLLGELHDNPQHHARRGRLVAELADAAQAADAALRTGPRDAVLPLVAEHLPRGHTRVVDRGVRPARELLARLQAAGFDDKGWRWPLHRALFLPLAHLPLAGGNAPRDLVRAVARGDDSSLPDEVRALLHDTVLAPAAMQRLDQALLDGHCGHLGAARLPAMRQAQRVRDACMALALLQARHDGGPAVLLAGNGHVRRDHGVPAYLAARRPDARVVSIAFAEPGAAPDPAFDLVWITPAAARSDPCAGFKGLPR